MILDYGSVLNYSRRDISENQEYDVFELKSSNHSKELFTFLADNSTVEWDLATGGWIASGAEIDYLTTSHSEGTDYGISDLLEKQLSKGYCLLHLYHNHPNGAAFPSGLGYGIWPGHRKGDKQHAVDVSRVFGDAVRFSIYTSAKKQFTSYGPNSSIADFLELYDFHGR